MGRFGYFGCRMHSPRQPKRECTDLICHIEDGETPVRDLVDIAIPSSAQAAAETLGLRVIRNISSGAWVRNIPRDEAEIAVECLRDWGIAARIVARGPDGEPPAAPSARRAA